MFLIDISCRFCVQCSEEGRTEVSVTGQAEEINVNGLNDVFKDLCDLVGVDNMQKSSMRSTKAFRSAFQRVSIAKNTFMRW